MSACESDSVYGSDLLSTLFVYVSSGMGID